MRETLRRWRAVLMSMTGFGRAEGSTATGTWAWEIRSVNARGFELRLRLPAGAEGLELPVREMAQKFLRRGNVQASLTLRDAPNPAPAVNEALLGQLMQAARRLAAQFPGTPPPRVEALLAMPGVLSTVAPAADESGALQTALVDGFRKALDALIGARQGEGERLGRVVLRLVDETAALHAAAVAGAEAQGGLHRQRLLASLQALLGETPVPSEERLAQEVALLAVKSDVREELDRLASHIEAARALFGSGGAVGRQADFLVQEFVRETNTLCSKSASSALTGTGLRLKAVIEQLREQVQNLE